MTTPYTITLSPADIFSLTHPSGPGFIIKDNVLPPSVLEQIYNETLHLSSRLRPAGMGKLTDKWTSTMYRGDQMEWLTSQYYRTIGTGKEETKSTVEGIPRLTPTVVSTTEGEVSGDESIVYDETKKKDSDSSTSTSVQTTKYNNNTNVNNNNADGTTLPQLLPLFQVFHSLQQQLQELSIDNMYNRPSLDLVNTTTTSNKNKNIKNKGTNPSSSASSLSVGNIGLENTHCSVQIAAYERNGQSHYTRHRDAFQRSNDASANVIHSELSPSLRSSGRVITAIFYPHIDWKENYQGYLRLYASPFGWYRSKKQQSPETNGTEANDEIIYDILPQGGRLVLFRSEDIEHEVLPSPFLFSSTDNAKNSSLFSNPTHRYAYTMWMNGWTGTDAFIQRTLHREQVLGTNSIIKSFPEKSNHTVTSSSTAILPSIRTPTTSPSLSLEELLKGLPSNLFSKVSQLASTLPLPSHPVPSSSSTSKGADISSSIPFVSSPVPTVTSLPRIFVTIPAYRDSETQHTIIDLFEKAKYSSRIFVGVCWQYENQMMNDISSSSSSTSFFPYNPSVNDKDHFHYLSTFIRTNPQYKEQIRSILMDSKAAAGPVWARHLACSLYHGEEFIAYIDSHMRFVPGWDEILIQQLYEAERINTVNTYKRIILTTYPQGYQRDLVTGMTVIPTINDDDDGEKELEKFDDTKRSEVFKVAGKLADPLLYMPLPRCYRPTVMVKMGGNSSSNLSTASSSSLVTTEWTSESFPRYKGTILETIRSKVDQSTVIIDSSLRETLRSNPDYLTDPIVSQRFPPLLAPYYAAGCSFARSSHLRDVPPDPHLKYIFFGEESSVLLRSWSKGYVCYHPGITWCYHLWTRNYRPSFRETTDKFTWYEQEHSIEQLRRLFRKIPGILQEKRPIQEEKGRDRSDVLTTKEEEETQNYYGLGTVQEMATLLSIMEVTESN